MYSTAGLKFSRRWRRMAWRLNTTTFAAFVGSAVVTLAAMRGLVSAAGPKDSYRRRTEAHGSYARRKHAETDDNPLYRLPEQPSGSQRLDGLSQWSAKAQQYQHH